jgi:hypothetical protein
MRTMWLAFRANWAFTVGLVILAVVALITLNTHRTNLALRDAIRKANTTVVAAGDFVGEVSGTTASGTYARYRLLGTPLGSLVIAMSPQCGFCQRSMWSWRQLSAHARRLGLQVVWVNRDALRSDPTGQTLFGWDPDVVADPTYTTFVSLKLMTVPQTIVIGADGIVKHAIAGAVDADRQATVTHALDVLAHGRE